jgi:acyl-CoA synthetase (AMP-forming)/AMP-acid ligase II
MEFNLADIFECLADAFPDRPALACGDVVLTFGQLDERATRLTNAWKAAGIGAGDHVGLYLFNGHPYVEAMLAAWKLRARTINVNYRYVAAELAYMVDNAELKGLLYQPELEAEVEAVDMPTVVFKQRLDDSYEATLAEASAERDFGPRSQDDLFLLYTGGTTGMPKGVMWTHRDLFYAALQGGQPGGDSFTDAEAMAPALKSYGDGIHILTAAPLIHGSSQLASWIAMLNGGLGVIAPGRSYDPIACLDACDAHDVNTFNMVGDAMALPLVEALEAHPGRWKLQGLSVLSSAGAVLSAHVIAKLEALIPHAMVLNSFGSSETGHQGVAIYEDGKAVWFMDDEHTVVLDDDLELVPPGSDVVGKLARRGHIPLGYWRDEAKTAATFKEKDGVRYVLQGDMAQVAEDGSVIFLGRGSVCINTGGEKVFAEEVEEVLKHHPSVFDSVVVGVPDPKWGSRVEALVTVRDGAAFDASDVEAFCRAKLAGYKTPRAIWVVDDLNRQPSGKPDYRWARARAEQLGARA